MREFEFDCTRLSHTWPSECRAAIIEILGCIRALLTEFVFLGRAHFLRRKSDMPSHVSSMFMIVFLLRSNFRNARANYCLRMRFLSEFVLIVSGFTFLYRILSSRRMIW